MHPDTARSDVAGLVAAARDGDHAAFHELYRNFSRMVHGILLARVPYEAVEDLVQDVFLQAFRQLPRLRDPAAVGGWLAAIARNLSRDHFRRARETSELTDVHAAPGSTSAAAEAAAVLAELLAAARPRDVFSFQELLRTARGEERRRLIDRGIDLLPPPPGVTRAGLLRGDEYMMNAWRKQLGIGEAKRWWLDWRDILPQ